ICRLGLDGTLLEGDLPPVAHEVVHMHTAVYQEKDSTGCVIHTHSPFATAFAVAGRSILCWSEAAARFGMEDGVPVAAYGPRGSKESVDNIRKVLTPKSKAVLLANHGILAFHESALDAVRVCVALEETAQLALYASALGGPRVIPAEMLAYTQQRVQEFAAAGVVSSGVARQ
ncbi:MAG: class II aldolase/adducin family protein, partial [Dehalococcoidia bacterium]